MAVESVFSYFIAEHLVAIPELPVKKKFGKYTIAIDTNTPFSFTTTLFLNAKALQALPSPFTYAP